MITCRAQHEFTDVLDGLRLTVRSICFCSVDQVCRAVYKGLASCVILLQSHCYCAVSSDVCALVPGWSWSGSGSILTQAWQARRYNNKISVSSAGNYKSAAGDSTHYGKHNTGYCYLTYTLHIFVWTKHIYNDGDRRN